MDKTVLKRNILFGLLLVSFIIVFEIILARLHLPAWPAFLVMIQFFVVHEDLAKAPEIIVGGLFGIVCAVLIDPFKAASGPILGMEAAKLAFIGAFVYAIVMLKDLLPHVFNSHAFLFFLVSSIAKASGDHPRPYVWMIVELVFGLVFVAGILGMNRVVETVLAGADTAGRERA